jgi:hypothetical protein
MAPSEWKSMGGEICSDCSKCRQSEWSLATYLGRDQTNIKFKQHWETWFTQEDVDGIVANGLNTLRVPLGFWIVEDIVDKSLEPYAQGGLDELVWPKSVIRDPWPDEVHCFRFEDLRCSNKPGSTFFSITMPSRA